MQLKAVSHFLKAVSQNKLIASNLEMVYLNLQKLSLGKS
jgi:hypothetical protein